MSNENSGTRPPRTPTRRPTISVSAVVPNVVRLQEAILGTFGRYGVHAMDMEALIHFTLMALPELVDPSTFEGLHRLTREHILKNFAIHQSGPLRLNEISVYRLIVCHTSDDPP